MGVLFTASVVQGNLVQHDKPYRDLSNFNLNSARTDTVSSAINDENLRNPFGEAIESGSPSIFRRPHNATDYVVFDDEDWDTQDVLEFSDITSNILPGTCPYVPEKFLEDSKGELHQEKVEVFDRTIEVKPSAKKRNEKDSANRPTEFFADFSELDDASNAQPITETRRTYTTFKTSEKPGEVKITQIGTQSFTVLPDQLYGFNDLSTSNDKQDDNLNRNIRFQDPEINYNVEESFKFIVDFAESCKTSSEDLNQNVDKADTENLVEIVDVTEELNPRPREFRSSSNEKSDLTRKSDESVADNIKQRPKTKKSNTDPDKDINTDASSSDQASMPSVSDTRNERFLGAGGESISRLEDELCILEKLEDQIKLLEEEETKMKGIQEELKHSTSTDNKSQTTDPDELRYVDKDRHKEDILAKTQLSIKENIVEESSNRVPTAMVPTSTEKVKKKVGFSQVPSLHENEDNTRESFTAPIAAQFEQNFNPQGGKKSNVSKKRAPPPPPPESTRGESYVPLIAPVEQSFHRQAEKKSSTSKRPAPPLPPQRHSTPSFASIIAPLEQTFQPQDEKKTTKKHAPPPPPPPPNKKPTSSNPFDIPESTSDQSCFPIITAPLDLNFKQQEQIDSKTSNAPLLPPDNVSADSFVQLTAPIEQKFDPSGEMKSNSSDHTPSFPPTTRSDEIFFPITAPLEQIFHQEGNQSKKKVPLSRDSSSVDSSDPISSPPEQSCQNKGIKSDSSEHTRVPSESSFSEALVSITAPLQQTLLSIDDGGSSKRTLPMSEAATSEARVNPYAASMVQSFNQGIESTVDLLNTTASSTDIEDATKENLDLITGPIVLNLDRKTSISSHPISPLRVDNVSRENFISVASPLVQSFRTDERDGSDLETSVNNTTRNNDDLQQADANNVFSEGIVATGNETVQPNADLSEEKSKKKKNRKKRSKKNRDVDVETGDSCEELDKSAAVLKAASTEISHAIAGTSRFQPEVVNSEKEFQKMVSQLSVEEVNEALQIWNKDIGQISKISQSGINKKYALLY